MGGDFGSGCHWYDEDHNNNLEKLKKSIYQQFISQVSGTHLAEMLEQMRTTTQLFEDYQRDILMAEAISRLKKGF